MGGGFIGIEFAEQGDGGDLMVDGPSERIVWMVLRSVVNLKYHQETNCCTIASQWCLCAKKYYTSANARDVLIRSAFQHYTRTRDVSDYSTRLLPSRLEYMM